MAVYDLFPSGDVSDSGWAAIGASTSMWGTLSGAYNVSNYMSSPPNTGTGIMSFPLNITNLGAGAVIESISLCVTAGLGAGTPNPGQPASLTVGLMSADEPSRYTQSTIYPTAAVGSSIGYTVATYTVDPQGNKWDVQGLNNLWYQFWSKNGITDLVRVYNAWVVVNYKAVPTVTVNQPTGTLNTAAPVISWTYSQSEGDFQASAVYKLFTSDQQAAVGFNPTTSTPVYTGKVSGVTTAVQMTHALPSNSYFVYVQSTSYAGAMSNWGYQQFALAAPTPGVPGIADPSGQTPAGQGIVGVVADVNNGCADVTIQNTSNLLGTHMADVNIDDSGDEWGGVNVVPVESSTFFFPGDNTGQSWKFQAIAAGNMAADTGFVTVEPGQAYTVCCQALAATTARSVQLGINWYDSSYNYLGSSSSSFTSDVAGTWTQISFVDMDTDGLANATKAQLSITVVGCAINEAHYFTHVGIMPGNQTPYTSGGTASTNLLSSWYANAQGSAPSGESWVGTSGTTIGTYSGAPLGTSGQSGTNQNSMTCATATGSITTPTAGTPFTASSSGGSFTLNTPSGTAASDLMLAFLTYTSTTATAANVASGWSVVDSSTATIGGSSITLTVLARTAGASEPSSYTALLNNSGVATDRSAVVMRYPGAAPASQQFIAEGANSGTMAGTAFTTPTVTNTDPGAWRVSAIATGATSGTPTFTANTQPPGIPKIQYVSTAPVYSKWDGTNSYTLNRPPGVQLNDLMIATITADATAGTINAPSGWTVAHSIVGTGTTGSVLVMKRTATASEPSTWTGSFSTSPTSQGWQKMSTCTAYRNVAAASFQFAADGIAQKASTNNMWTPNVTNPNANAWRVVGFFGFGEAGSGNQVISLSGVGASMSARYAGSAQYGSYGSPGAGSIGMTFADSAGPVAPSVQSIHGGATSPFWSMAAWEAFLLPLSSAPTPPANETSRAAISVGTADSLAVFDSNGTVAAQQWSVSMTSSTSMTSEVSWTGLIRPAATTVSGYVSATLQTPVPLNQIDSNLITIAGEELTVGASFIGSVAGTAMVTASFYRANQLIQQNTQVAGQFNSTSSAWSDCFAMFDIPAGTTAIGMTLASPNHNIGDVVYWNRSMLALGNQGAYQPGTLASSHPIWSYPELQYSEDPGDGTGFGPWTYVPGTKTNVPAFSSTGLLVFQDHSIVPLRNRMYRARTVSYGLGGDKFTSPWSAQSDVVNFSGTQWWLKDLDNPANNLQLSVSWEDITITKQTTGVQFQGLGEQYPVFLTEGYKGDTLTLKLVPVNISDHGKFVNLLTSNKTLYLQSDIDEAWWVQPGSDIASTVLATFNRQSNPLRKVQITFFQVGPVQ
jgi:hypothetical protein